ncbi:type I glyceraldehyde-3-phosphate dehydrogenase [Rickettsiales bacterium LUAb2]
MAIKVAINGFGRIGRLSLRALIEAKRTDIEVVAINDLGSPEINAHLLQYDSIQRNFDAEVSANGDSIIVNGKAIKVFAEKDPSKLPWKDLGIDIVYECTGLFVSKEAASSHLKAGAKKVLISAPGKNADLTVVYGINHQKLQADHVVVSNASCTTNCLAPVAYVAQKTFGIKHGYMTTIHSYTGDQRILDSYHSGDVRRARAAALSMIPTSTGAASAVGLVLPELKGKLDGTSIRVPTPTVSIVDFTFVAAKNVTAEEVNKAMLDAATGELKGVLGVNSKPLVSCDFVHNPLSSIFDSTQTQVVENNFVRVLAWYDNEWGFSNRMSDTAVAMMKA